jgi:putative PEP-CTERM system histidine kinase
MLVLAADAVITAFTLRVAGGEQIVGWLSAGFVIKCLIPGIWLAFSLSYSRGDYWQDVWRWRFPIVLISLVPVTLALFYNSQLFPVVDAGDGQLRVQTGQLTKALNVVLLLSLMLVLMNVEQTFRSAVGTARWRLKFVVLGLVVIFGARIYVRAQAMLYSGPDLAQWGIESGGLLIGCVFLAVAYARTGLAEIDVYPSLAVLRSSITVLLVGGYLFIVGILAQLVRRFGGAESFQVQAFVVLLGMSGLALLLLSDRARQRIHVFTVRNFGRSRHDSLRIWTMLSEKIASVRDQRELCEASVRLISDTFDALSVSAWLADPESGKLLQVATTSPQQSAGPDRARALQTSEHVAVALQNRSEPFEIETLDAAWARELRERNPSEFPNGGSRWCVPLRAGERIVGAVVLGDRVNGATYNLEELELLRCIADQMASVQMNLRLAATVANAKELEAFRTLSTFFVHDLKNAASSLNLMLKNLPVHFDDPAFRADALRGIGNTTRRIEEMIERLGTLRQTLAVAPSPTDLNKLVTDALGELRLSRAVRVLTEFEDLPPVPADREHLKSVVANLVLNAAEAMDDGGLIRVRTEHQGQRVLVSVTDSGCGMSESFIRERLFRPFQSTKKKGLGIGLFQCRAIVQAHGGGIQVTSEPQKGTTFIVSLPVSVGR